MPSRKSLLLCLLVVLAVPAYAGTPSISLDASYVQLAANQSWQFRAMLSGGASGAIVWQVDNVAGGLARTGLVSAQGSYTAPSALPSPAAITVTASLASDPLVKSTATITLARTVRAGQTYYVSPSGDDMSTGTINTPFQTISRAAATAHAGDTVYVRQGVYNELVTPLDSGSASNGYITFSSYPGETATIDGAGLPIPNNQAGLITLNGKSYIVVQGFELRNYQASNYREAPIGIYVTGSGSDIQLINNHIHDIITTALTTPKQCRSNALGMAVYGTGANTPISNLVVSGNELDHLKTGCSESMSIDGNVDGFVVMSNAVHDNDNIGIDAIGFELVSPNPAVNFARNGEIRGNDVYNITSFGNPAYGRQYASDGIYVDGGAQITIEQNLVHNVDFGIELASEHNGHVTSKVIARNNVIYANNASGITIGGYAANKGGTDQCSILNNTLYANNARNQGAGEFQIQFNATNNLFANNIIFAGKQNLLVHGGNTQTSAPTSLDYNVYDSAGKSTTATWVIGRTTYKGFPNYQQGTGLDAQSVFANPMFVNTAGTPPDLDVTAGSPAIGIGMNYGTSLGVADFAGQPRVQNGKVDAGAFEN